MLLHGHREWHQGTGDLLFFRAEKKLGKATTPAQKLGLMQELKGKSTRQAQAMLMERTPEAIPKETLRRIGTEESRLTLVVSRELEEKLKRLKGLLAHRLPGATYAELLEAMADMVLKKLDPLQKKGHEAKSDSDVQAPAPEQYPDKLDHALFQPRSSGWYGKKPGDVASIAPLRECDVVLNMHSRLITDILLERADRARWTISSSFAELTTPTRI